MKIQELADKMGLTIHTIQFYETGIPTSDFVRRLY
ncbi:MerR family transcriptional regulator [Paenibacillus sp. J23TS9]|nr:MerR family transcriptional regulator [Paenibacillus sp. J23TS9]